MSEHICAHGTLKEIAIKEKTFEDKIDFIVKNYKIKKEDLCKDEHIKRERLYDDVFLYVSGKMFERINATETDNSDIIIEVKRITRTTFDYNLNFYNNYANSSEILEEEIKNILYEEEMGKKIVIGFKSDMFNYLKEESGRKPNTVRKVDLNDKRFIILKQFSATPRMNLWIRIIRTTFEKTFERKVKDVTFFDGYVIISWRD